MRRKEVEQISVFPTNFKPPKPCIMKTTIYTLSFFAGLFLFSCSSSTIKENLNKAGDEAGQAIGELATGISNGVKKAIEPKIEVSESLKTQGISFGKMTIGSDSVGKDNVLIAYVIFENNFNGQITAKLFDDKNLEMGRVKQDLKGKKDKTTYVEFHFDKRVEINNESKLTLE
jgi:predicted type IV restriction endonuclease